MKTHANVLSAWFLLVHSEGSPADRLKNAFVKLLEISDGDLPNFQCGLLKQLPLSRIRSFGSKELGNYFESLDQGKAQQFADTIARMYLRQSGN